MNYLLHSFLFTYAIYSVLAFLFLMFTCLPDISVSFRFFLDYCELFKVGVMVLFPISTLLFFLVSFLFILINKFLDFSFNYYPFRSKDKNKINLDKKKL